MDEPTIPSFLEPDTPEEIPDRIDHRTLPRPGSQDDRKHYSDSDKVFALAVYAETGSFETAAREANIPPSTLRYWVENNPAIDAEIEAIRGVLRKRLAWKYAEGAELAVDQLLDRLRNGDEIINKSGEYVRRKVPARELAFIASIFTDKHALLAGTMTKTNQEDQTLATLAKKLVNEFASRRMRVGAIDAACGGAAQIAGTD